MRSNNLARASALLAMAFLSGAPATLAAQAPAALDASALAGRWEAIVVANSVEVPFELEIVAEGAVLKGSFFNGDRKVTSSAGNLENGVLVLPFDQYGAKLRLSAQDGGGLAGEYQRARGGPLPVRVLRLKASPAAASDAPSIAGTWIVGTKSSKGETAWRFIATQSGGQVSATILRVDGDTGTLTGSYRDGRFVLSHFSGARPLLLEVTPGDNGKLLLKQNGKTELTAAREDAAAAAGIGTPTDPALHTTVKDPSEPFRFSFPDLTGALVSNTDPRFAGKVVLVNISGSWCPNCHDEAPFLASLYRKYRDRGLEIVTLSFEEPDQLANPTRLRAFIATYGLEYTVLLAGDPDQLEAKVPQAVNLNSFPTTFMLGCDGRVRAVHAGFPSPGSREYYEKAERDITEQVERLLAERASTR